MIHFFRSNDKYFPYLMGVTFLFLIWGIFIGSWVDWLVAFFMYFCFTCLGITVTFHRNFAHRSYKTYSFLEKLFTIFGCLGGTGSSIGWVAVHRTHHKFSDKNLDPHSPHTGSIWGLFINKYNFDFNKWVVRDLITNPFHKFLHDYYYLLILFVSLILLMFGLKYFIFILAIPMFLNMLASSLSVYLGHSWGYRTWEIEDKSVNNWLNALLVWGEGWHNNHHRKASNYTFKNKWWEIDIGGLIVSLIRKKGYNDKGNKWPNIH